MTFEEVINSIKEKPYYQDDAVVIYCADCRDILPQIPDKSIDLVLTDPPYGIDLDLEWLSDIHIAQHKPANRIDAKLIGDLKPLDLTILKAFDKWVVWGYPYLADLGSTGWLVWDKQPGLLDTDRTMTTPVEIAQTNAWNGYRLIRAMWAGFMRDDGEQRFGHPTQKPLKVMTYCLNKTKATTILDPFLGSGTTAVAAKILGRKCIGIEIEEKYCKIAADRCRQSVMQLDIKPKPDYEQGVLS